MEVYANCPILTNDAKLSLIFLMKEYNKSIGLQNEQE